MIMETYAERQRRLETGDTPDVYTYDTLPAKLKIQIFHVLTDGIGSFRSDSGRRYWTKLENLIARAEGLRELWQGADKKAACEMWFHMTSDIRQLLSLVELGATMLEIEEKPELIEELNHRFRQNAVGYQFEGGQIIRIDSQFIHAELIKPAITHLSGNMAFEIANDEFMAAHKNYREGSNQDAVVAANRAFESTLKAICSKKNWPYESGARASDLIKVVRKHGLFPDYLDNSFDNYIAAMKSGLPGVRNNAGGHGAAPGSPEVPNYVAAYAIHLSAANIVLAIDASNIT
jgi:hypothetical protein